MAFMFQTDLREMLWLQQGQAMFSQIAEITDNLYLSSAAAVKGDKIRSLGITHIINVTMDIPNVKIPNVESIQIHVDDVPSARLSIYFDRCSDKINQVRIVMM